MSATLPATANSALGEPAPGFLDPTHASLARELAQDIRPANEVLETYGFTGSADPRWIALARSATFARAMLEAQKEWSAVDSTSKRIRYKAQASLELLLPEMHRLALDGTVPMSTRAEAWRFIKSCSGIDAPKGPGGFGGEDAAGGVRVTINIGEKTLTASLAPRTPMIDGESEDA